MILQILSYIKGYVVIKVSGFSVERFLNLATYKGIYIWDMTYTKDGVYMKVSVKGFKMLRSCAKKTKCKIEIVKKVGCPFYLFRYRKRKLLAGGVVFFIFMMYFLSSFIWLVEIDGNERISAFELMKHFEEYNIRVGGFKPSISKKEAEKALINNFPDISWVNVQIKGTKATIYVTEILPKSEIMDTSIPCNVIAEKDGVITNIVTSYGTPLKKEKDVVYKDDVIVSGELIIKDDETGRVTEYTHAYAEVYATTYYQIELYVPYEYEERLYTGKSKKYYSLSLFDKKIRLSLFKPSIKYTNYDKITFRNQAKLSDDYPLPFVFIKEEYREFVPVKKTYSFEQAMEIGEQRVTGRIIHEFDFEIDVMEKELEFEETPESLKVNALIIASERIDSQAEITEGNYR